MSRKAANTSGMSEIDRLTWQIDLMTEDLAAARQEDSSRATAAVAALHRGIAILGRELDAAKAKAQASGQTKRTAETPETLRAAIMSCTEAQLVIIEEAVADRRAGIKLRVVRSAE